jgi:hypothetical protein
MPEQKVSIGGKYGKGKKKGKVINPADVFQTMRQGEEKGVIKKPQFIRAGTGMWEGTVEPSYQFAADVGKKGMGFIRGKLKQQAVYSESSSGYALNYPKQTDKTIYKYIIYVNTGGKAINEQELARLLTATKSRYHLFSGGTIYKQEGWYVIESALFYGSEAGIGATQTQGLFNMLRKFGFVVQTKLVRMR